MTTISRITTPQPPAASTLFPAPLWQQVQQLLRSLDERQSLWLSGYLAAPRGTDDEQHSPADTAARIVVAFGSETGNSQALAKRLADMLIERSISGLVSSLAELKPRALSRLDYLLIVCSTHGDGDPPEPCIPFFEGLLSDEAPALSQLKFAVLALGDSSYEQYCTAGTTLDQRLEQLGGQRLLARVECDVDFEKPAQAWLEQVVELLPRREPRSLPVAATAAAPTLALPSKQQPAAIEVLENICLSDPRRQSPIHHLTLLLDGEWDLRPGDAVGVIPHNPPALVAAVLKSTGLAGDEPVMVEGAAVALVQALREQFDLTVPGQQFVRQWADLTGAAELVTLTQSDSKAQRVFLRATQILDILRKYRATPAAQAFVDCLRPLQPRLYDVANYLGDGGDEIQLTVQAYSYPFNDISVAGVASSYLLQLQPGEMVRLYPHRNKRQHLPEQRDAPLILVAVGTGIAPYRAFMQSFEREQRQHRCWLAFQECTFEADFLYQLDWQAAAARGHLQHVETAFIDDAPECSLAGIFTDQKDRLLEWLERGAHVYFSGDRAPLTQCESRLQQLYEARAGAGAWKQLARAERIHRNLY